MFQHFLNRPIVLVYFSVLIRSLLVAGSFPVSEFPAGGFAMILNLFVYFCFSLVFQIWSSILICRFLCRKHKSEFQSKFLNLYLSLGIPVHLCIFFLSWPNPNPGFYSASTDLIIYSIDRISQKNHSNDK